MSELRVKRPVVREIGLQDKGLKEPGDMCQVPLGGADIGHGLDLAVFRFQRLTQGFAGGTYRGKGRADSFTVCRDKRNDSAVLGACLAQDTRPAALREGS